MKLNILLLLTLFILSIKLQAKQRLFIFMGQSNMAGRAHLEPQDSIQSDRIFILNDKGAFIKAQHPFNTFSNVRKDMKYQRLSMVYSFVQTISEAYANDTILMVVNARGGSALAPWLKGSDLGYYEKSMLRIQQALKVAPKAEIDAIIWHQGESNRNDYQNYLSELNQMVEDYRKDLGIADLSFIAGNVGHWNDAYANIRKELPKIPEYIENAYFVSSKGLTNFDEHHFDRTSQLEFGKRYAKKYLSIAKDKNFSFSFLEKMLYDPIDNYVMVVAHRGDWRNAPENSRLSIQNCIDMGVDMVEIDVRLSKEGVPILMHDKTLDRTTNGKGKVNDFTLSELKKLKLKDKDGKITAHTVPTLEEAMLLAKGKILINLDKVDKIIPQIFPVLKKTNTVKQVTLGTYLPLDEMRELAGVYLDSLCYMPKIKDNSKNITAFLNEFEAELDFSVVQVRFEKETAPTLEYLDDGEQYNSWIWVNTITANRSANHHDDRALTDPEGSYGWLIERKVNMMQTDRPALLLEYLKKQGLH
ncbi:MAG: sialate O-acetylesterase [Bacteroidota bacterium]